MAVLHHLSVAVRSVMVECLIRRLAPKLKECMRMRDIGSTAVGRRHHDDGQNGGGPPKPVPLRIGKQAWLAAHGRYHLGLSSRVGPQHHRQAWYHAVHSQAVA